MDVCLIIRQRLEELGLEQKDLAAASGVTESYVSQLLARKKLPPAPDRTDIYNKMDKFLKLPGGKLAGLAEHQRREGLRRSLAEPPAPLLKGVRELILRKCVRGKEKEIRAIFEKQPFGELERLVTQKLLLMVKELAQEELESENWLRLVARLGGRSYEQMRVAILEFLDADIFEVSVEDCVSFLEPLIESWDINLATFAMDVSLNRRLAAGHAKRFEFVAKEASHSAEEEPGLKQFLRNVSMSGDASDEEIDFLQRLRFTGRHPTALYYYRELQNLRDPVHFEGPAIRAPGKKTRGRSQPKGSMAPMHRHMDADRIEKQLQLDGRKRAVRRWAENKSSRAKRQKRRS
jgi:transcriptional regulator with XRE-family HTH domain